MERLNDGQFGECDITLKELQTVEDSLVKSLCTFYHGRVAYPKGCGPQGRNPTGRGGRTTGAAPTGIVAGMSSGRTKPVNGRRPLI